MKVVAYSIKIFEKEPLAIANRKKHEITLISNVLSTDTVSYATGKEAVIVFEDDDVSADVINKLADMGVKYIATRSTSSDHIDRTTATARAIRIANVPSIALAGVTEAELPMVLAEETILNLDKWQQKKCLGLACVCSRSCDKINHSSLDNHNSHSHEHTHAD
ncbi:D-lactate dehydrogenase [Pedobacter sp. ok626]|uniref:lactate dehydrogenase n=1 Tax=Pedobacter sp. ok626 TaxID=1761882 RepID=UPI00088F260C|nr:lactate dehydrogenase [Pedobacter sp. ok626]SDL03842.1 D-lactate dehydrogenase [Pedobacter sp. ok626]